MFDIAPDVLELMRQELIGTILFSVLGVGALIGFLTLAHLLTRLPAWIATAVEYGGHYLKKGVRHVDLHK